MSYTEQEVKDLSRVPVKVMPGAFQKMLMHVLRFGSPGIPKDQWRECYGMLVGHFKGKQVHVVDALPTTHGSDIGVEFVEENYVIMAEFMDQLDRQNEAIANADEKLFIVGWYHSHPGMERFLSSVDVRNQIAYQPASFPFGIAIVFDNTCVFQMEPVSGQLDMGFKIFRLDDPSSTEINIPFSEVPFDRSLLDKPELVELWRNEMTMIENVQKRAPVIKEYRETPSVFGDFKLPTTAELDAAGTGITGEERAGITVLPLAELDQVFTRGMQLFIEKFQQFSPGEQAAFDELLDKGIGPALDAIVATVVAGLNDWSARLRVDIDKRVNYGIASLDSIKAAVKGTQDAFLDHVKANADAAKDKARELAGSIDTTETRLKAIFKEGREDCMAVLNQASGAWRAMMDAASKQLGQTELARIHAELQRLAGGPAGGSDGGATAGGSSTAPDGFGDVLARHLAAVTETMERAPAATASTSSPPLLGNFTIPTTAAIASMDAFVPAADEVTADLLDMKGIGTAVKDGMRQFIAFYNGLPPEQRASFQHVNENGIQPFSDMVVSSLVKGINQWTIALRDDIDRRVNLLVSVANEMQRTMKTIQAEYTEFLVSSTDPTARLVLEARKTVGGVETATMTTVNSVLAYMQQVMENLIYYYQEQLPKQQQALDQKELKNIAKTLEQLAKKK